MCGIAGFFSKKKNEVKNKINLMLDTIVHRGPDGCGTKIFYDRLALGHRRLSVIDLSVASNQPMQYGESYWITYNGEIYNYLELKEELLSLGYSFKTKSDTEVILACYVEWGEGCVDRFNGMWSFAIYDDKRKILFCSRDRFGVKPFYYLFNKDSFVFASEIKAIVKILDQSPRVNHSNINAFLVKGTWDSDEETMFDGIMQLMGGCNLIFDCGEFNYKIYCWYDLMKCAGAITNHYSLDENINIFKKLFTDSINLRLRSDVSVGCCLSGGLDSSSIVCVSADILKEANHEQHVITSCFDDTRYDERDYAQAVIDKTKVISHQVFPDMSQVFVELDRLIWHMDEPLAGTSGYAQWNVFKEARKQNLTVMLDGQGSDEQLAGYTNFYKVLFLDLLRKVRIKKLFHELNCYKNLRVSTEAGSMMELMLSVVGTFFLPDNIRYIAYNRYKDRISGSPFSKEMYYEPKAENNYRLYDKRNPQKFIYAGMTQGLRGLLHSEDRNSMAHSIESRVPFLDYKLVEFVFSVPIDQKIRDGRTKYLLREALKDYLPKKVYNRYSKLGFATPEDVWLKDNQELFRIELSKACDRLSDIIDKKRVMKWYEENAKNTRRGDTTCFRIISVAHWADVFDVNME